MSVARSLVSVPSRARLAVAVTAAVLAVAFAAGLVTPSATSGPLVFVETMSARASGILLLLGARAPLGYALVAGMVASVNPCGFVLLPAYLGLYLGDDRSGGRPVGRAIVVAATVSASFVVLFGLAGILASLAASAVTASLPWVGVGIGACLILLGGVLAAGGGLGMPLGPRAANRLKAVTRRRDIGGYAAYGTAYGLASLGCTLPVFLAVVGTSLQVDGLAAAVGQFMLFGAGMGLVLGALTIATAWFGQGFLSRVQPFRRHVGWASAVLLWLAGAYVVYYWLTAIRLL
jgi:cytochrome c-type biogenesis protein